METNDSIWARTAKAPAFAQLKQDRDDIDVLIIGGGLTGLTAAYWLALAGKRVMLVEARRIGMGVSHRSTAHLTEAIDTRYYELASTFGTEGARLVAESSRAAIESISALSNILPCDFVRRPGFLFTEREAGIEELEREYHAAQKADLPVELLSFAPVPFATKGALRFPDQAQFHIQRYVIGLAKAARSLGAEIYENSRAIAIEDGDPLCTVHLEHGPTIRARAVFVATHAPLNRVFLQTKIAAYRSYVVTYPGIGLTDGLYWDTEDPYHYFSSFTFDGQPHLIIGGSDHKTGTETNTEEHFETLAHWTKAHGLAPDIVPELRWSAQVEEPVDGLPFIGRNSANTNVYVATGFSGNGTTFGTIAALIVRDLILNKPNPWAELYEATRVTTIQAGTYLDENIDFPMHLVSDWIKPPQAERVEDISRGDGKTVKVNGERLAVYRDDEGRLHAVSAVCTHLGCEVKFNSAERSWDCPCHGSRFTVDGSVIDGPALRPLARRGIEGQRTTSQVMPKVAAARKKRTARG